MDIKYIQYQLDQAVNGTLFDGINHDDNGLLDAIRHKELPQRYHAQVELLISLIIYLKDSE